MLLLLLLLLVLVLVLFLLLLLLLRNEVNNGRVVKDHMSHFHCHDHSFSITIAAVEFIKEYQLERTLSDVRANGAQHNCVWERLHEYGDEGDGDGDGDGEGAKEEDVGRDGAESVGKEIDRLENPGGRAGWCCILVLPGPAL
jgi:hypothetical protein